MHPLHGLPRGAIAILCAVTLVACNGPIHSPPGMAQGDAAQDAKAQDATADDSTADDSTAGDSTADDSTADDTILADTMGTDTALEDTPPPLEDIAEQDLDATDDASDASAEIAPPDVTEGPAIVISELMADNAGALLDGDGETSDWLELYNPGPDIVALGGWGLSDDAADPWRWILPDETLVPGGYLLVFASGKAVPPAQQRRRGRLAHPPRRLHRGRPGLPRATRRCLLRPGPGRHDRGPGHRRRPRPPVPLRGPGLDGTRLRRHRLGRGHPGGGLRWRGLRGGAGEPRTLPAHRSVVGWLRLHRGPGHGR